MIVYILIDSHILEDRKNMLMKLMLQGFKIGALVRRSENICSNHCNKVLGKLQHGVLLIIFLLYLCVELGSFRLSIRGDVFTLLK